MVLIFKHYLCPTVWSRKTSHSIIGSSYILYWFLVFLVAACANASTSDGFIVPQEGTITAFSLDNDDQGLELPLPIQAAAYKLGFTLQTEFKGLLIKPAGGNLDGCRRIDHPPSSPASFKGNGWIIILKKYGCSYEKKARNAYNAGLDGMILSNDESNETEILGMRDNRLVELPILAYSIGSVDGDIISDFDYETGFYIKICTPLSVLEVAMLFVVWIGLGGIIFIFAYALLKPLYPRIIRPQFLKFLDAMKIYHLRKSINAIPVVKWTHAVKSQYETCVVCLEDYVEEDLIRVLNCSHGFHQPCVDSWFLKAQRYCPLCKQKFEYSTIWGKISEPHLNSGGNASFGSGHSEVNLHIERLGFTRTSQMFL